MRDAVSKSHATATLQQRRAAVLLRSCGQLAASADILELFDREVHETGLVGEHRNAKVIFLAMISRIQDRPVSIVITGSSSGGKSTLAEAVLKFFPKSAYLRITGMSEKALMYLSESLKDRFLFVVEAAGLQEGAGMVALRNLLSEGRVRYQVVSGGKTLDKVLEGPTGLLMTTTDLTLYPDDNTRLLCLEISDTPAQTTKVLMAIAKQEAGGAKSKRKPDPTWQALTEWLAIERRDVVIPFATSIAALTDNSVTRVRRDFKAFLGLLKAHALLHQLSRDKDEEGRVIASFKDYRAVRALVKESVAQGIDASVKPGVKAAVLAVKKILAMKRSATVANVAAEMRLHKSNASRHISKAVAAGYLQNLETVKGRSARFVIANSLPDDREVLPTTRRLKDHHLKLEPTTTPPAADRPKLGKVRRGEALGRFLQRFRR